MLVIQEKFCSFDLPEEKNENRNHICSQICAAAFDCSVILVF